MRRLRSILALAAALAVMGAFASAAIASEQMEKPKKRHARVYVEQEYARECHTGWWRTWRYGHEWPRWGTWCRR
jgi:hypothetical protein